MHKCLLFIILFICLSLSKCITIEVLNYGDPNNCNRSEIFNADLMKCQLCDAKKFLIPSKYKNKCICNEFSVPKYDASKLSTIQCEKCSAPNSIFSTQIKKCIKCAYGYIKKNNVTECKPCRDNEIMLYKFTNGTLFNQTRCLPCSNGMIPSKDSTECIPCPIENPVQYNGTFRCTCDYKSILLGQICVLKSSFLQLANTKNKYVFQYHNGESVESNLFEKYLKESIFLCKLQNTTSCQFLANLCTLTLYSDYENSPCGIWLENRYNIIPENINYLPWLFYREGEANVVLNRKKISIQYSLNPALTMSKLNLTAVIFNLDGTVKEIRNLLGSSLNICPDLDYLKDEGLRFGVNYKYECRVDVKQLFRNKNTEFVVPYLQYWENGMSMLHAVPVLIRNLVQYRNNDDDPSNWQLVRRFFMYDAISSISSKTNKPSVLRYVKSIEIRTKLRKEDINGLIYPPLLILDYGEVSQEQFDREEKVFFKFSTVFEKQSSFKSSIEIFIGILSGFAILYSGIQSWSFSKRSGKIGIDGLTLLRICIFACGNLANVFFLVVFSASVYIFILYKGQTVVHLLLPTTKEESIIKSYIISAFCLKIIELGVLIWNQISIDIFLIDWEKPRPQDTIPRPKKSASSFALSSSSSQNFVSIWRSYFIANEWNEIQTFRKVNILAHMLIVTFLLKIIGLEYWSLPDPEFHTKVPEYYRTLQLNFLCKFAVYGLVYIFAYLVQFCYMKGFYERYVKNPIQQFVDVCSLANISVFIMSLERYGFYIHGRSSHGFADTDMATMLKQLKREEEDLCARRGLLPGTYRQTFSVGVPAKLRNFYNKLLNPTKTNTFRPSIHLPEYSPNKTMDSETFDKKFQAYQNLNKFFSAFLEHALKDLDYDVIEKTFIESLLDIEFSDCSDRGKLYDDTGHSFDNVLFYGNEFCLFSFDIMLFSFVTVFCDNFIVIILSTFCVLEAVKLIRCIGGKRNLAQKTLIDEKFLI